MKTRSLNCGICKPCFAGGPSNRKSREGRKGGSHPVPCQPQLLQFLCSTLQDVTGLSVKNPSLVIEKKKLNFKATPGEIRQLNAVLYPGCILEKKEGIMGQLMKIQIELVVELIVMCQCQFLSSHKHTVVMLRCQK